MTIGNVKEERGLTKRVQRGLYDIVCNQVGPGAANDESSGLVRGTQRDRANPGSTLFIFVLRLLLLNVSGILIRRLTGHKEHL